MASFMRFRKTEQSGAVARRYAFLSRGTGDGSDAGARMRPPIGLTVLEATLRGVSFPGASSHNLQFSAPSGTPVGPVLSVSDTSPTLRADVAVSLAFADQHHLIRGGTTGVAGIINTGWRYECSDPNSDISLFGAGDEASNITLAGTSRFFGLDGSGTAEGNASNTVVQAPWPVAGTFLFLYGNASATGGVGTVAQVWLQKNGADTAITIPNISTAAPYGDLVHGVSVAAGDLISFRYIRTAGTGVSFTAGLILGFRASY